MGVRIADRDAEMRSLVRAAGSRFSLERALPGGQVVIAEWTPEERVYCGDGNMHGPGAEKDEV